MSSTANTVRPLAPAVLVAQPPSSFQPGDLVVIAGSQPVICTVVDDGFDGRIQLSLAACPELSLFASAVDVQPLSTWLMTQVSAAGPRPSGRH
jgi:hypothetical protein